jgi:hypothetical protein
VTPGIQAIRAQMAECIAVKQALLEAAQVFSRELEYFAVGGSCP